MSSRVKLWIGSGFEAAWAVARPWLESAARAALLADKPWAILLPTRAHAHALKTRALEHGLNLGAVFFLTPGEARERMRCQSTVSAKLAPQELRILLLTALMEEMPSPIREPARLLRALDQLDAGGWNPRDLGFAPAAKIADAFTAAMREAGWCSAHQLDRSLFAEGKIPSFSNLLVIGFDAAHWEQVHLLLAAANAADRAELVLAAPRSKAEALDMAWIGTFEEHYGAAAPIECDPLPGPFAALSQRMENPTIPLTQHAARPHFHIGRTLRDQAEAAVARALAFACAPDALRIGIVVPGPGPLAREIAAGLQRRGIPYFDAFGRRPPPDGASRRWRAWIAFQRAPTLASLFRLMAEHTDAAARAALCEELDRAFSEIMVDDLAVLRARLLAGEHSESRDAARALDHYAILPARAALIELASSTARAWNALGWDDLSALLNARRSEIAPLADRAIAASSWLDWLDAVAPDPAPIRAPDAANPLARIHLLGYGQAEGQPWTHLILTGLNEGEWPPPADSTGLLSDERIAELNRAALKQGRQGEGHVAAQPLHALILGSMERREILRRQFYNLVEAPTRGLAACCALEREDGSGRLAPAGDFLSHLYFSATDRPLTEDAMKNLCARTREWVARMPAAHAVEPPPQPMPVSAVHAAWTARRALTPFGPYDCAFTQPPPSAITLSCRAWEEAVRNPFETWFQTFLRVSPPPDWQDSDPWPKTQGMWVHRWLAKAICEARGRFEVRRAGSQLVDRAQAAAAQTRTALASVFTAGGRPEPQWWRAHLAQAEWMALSFAQRLAAIEDWPVAAVEWRLNRGIEIPLPGGPLRTYGFIDALFAQSMPERGVPEAAWIVDFKTGKEAALSERKYAKSLRRGHGIQISLYALALAALGAKDVAISLLTSTDAAKPQLPLDALRGEENFWRGLVRMQETGIFGMRGAVRAEYGPSLAVPLATIPVDPDRLEEKWSLTHPDLAEAEAEDE